MIAPEQKAALDLRQRNMVGLIEGTAASLAQSLVNLSALAEMIGLPAKHVTAIFDRECKAWAQELQAALTKPAIVRATEMPNGAPS